MMIRLLRGLERSPFDVTLGRVAGRFGPLVPQDVSEIVERYAAAAIISRHEDALIKIAG